MQPMETFIQYPKLQTVAYSNILLKLCREARETNDNVIHFDLSKTEFMTPFGIILVAGTVSECLANNKAAKYKRPEKETTRRFLSGIGFNKFFKLSGDAHKIESPHVQLRSLTHIDYLLTDQILDVFKQSLKMSEGVVGSLKMALTELMTNVFDHSESTRGCYVCVQSYPMAKKIRLCIADFGIGILRALKKSDTYGYINTDYKAISLAVQEGVTSRVGRDAGYGLRHIERFMEINEGIMHILSGEGKVSWNYSGIKKRKNLIQKMLFPFQGTIVNLQINADKEGCYFMVSEDGQMF